MHDIRVPFLILALLLPASRVAAQGQDPMREIQEIARSIDEQLQEIDRLLLESGKKNQAREKPKELLQRARERSEAVEGGLEKLIEKLNEMKNQGGGGGAPQEQQQNQQEPQDQQGQGGQQRPQQGQRNRRENQMPDIVPRPRDGQPGGQQPEGQQPQQPGQGQPQPSPGKPQGGQENPDGGANTRGNQQPEPETGPGSPGTGDGSWGELQPYMNFLKNRGSRPPQVPERFRKYWEAYLKQKQGQRPAGG